MDLWHRALSFFHTGGDFMWPILAVLVLGLLLGVERYARLFYERQRNNALWGQLKAALERGDISQARALVQDNRSSLGRLLERGFERQAVVRRREDVEVAMEEVKMDIIPRLQVRTHYIGLGANIATLLGLLGTIMGLIAAFTAVADAAGADKSSLLSASISVAMNTTAFGLLVGITLLILHTFLNTMTAQIIDDLNIVSARGMHLLSVNEVRRRTRKKPRIAQDHSVDSNDQEASRGYADALEDIPHDADGALGSLAGS